MFWNPPARDIWSTLKSAGVWKSPPVLKLSELLQHYKNGDILLQLPSGEIYDPINYSASWRKKLKIKTHKKTFSKKSIGSQLLKLSTQLPSLSLNLLVISWKNRPTDTHHMLHHWLLLSTAHKSEPQATDNSSSSNVGSSHILGPANLADPIFNFLFTVQRRQSSLCGLPAQGQKQNWI